MLLERNQINFLKTCENKTELSKCVTFFFEKSQYVGVRKNDKTTKRPWRAKLHIDGKQQYLGCFKTEIEAAKCVNFVCKKESMKIKNPELSDEETETFTWPLPPRKVAIFL